MFKQTLTTNNVTKWTNTCEYIIIHHTATWNWSIKWVLKTLTQWKVSCHFVIDTNWDMYKIWTPENILWHAWVSSWNGKIWMNNYSIWIEVIWPLPWFTYEQKVALKTLVRHLMSVYKIPKQNVLRHKDISPWRKIDIDDSFWNEKYKSWTEYQNSL